MKKKLFAMLCAVCIMLSSLVIPAYAEQADKIQLNPEATTRGGFTVLLPEKSGKHGWPFGAYAGDISEVGYVEEEYFIEGKAQHYEPVGALTDDGKWTLTAGDALPYKTRFMVRRPADPAKFNGIVVVEWSNVSVGYELSFMDSEGLYKEGFAYVAASVQRNGLYGFEENPQGIIAWDDERYGDLSIPDDGLSYDIFTQIARAVGKDRPTNGIDPMGGLAVKKLYAAGESQSGSRVLSYANGVQPLEKVFDAIITVTNSGRGVDFLPEIAHTKVNGKTEVRNVSSRIREDINCKVFIINSQMEAAALGKLVQPDTANIVSWQIAGATHLPPEAVDRLVAQNKRDGLPDLLGTDDSAKLPAVNWTFAYEAALMRITEWIDDDKQPPQFEPLDSINMILGYDNDKHGNAKGGVRLPEISAPIATYDVSLLGGMGGSVYAFKQNELLKLYPTHQDYVDKVTQEANTAARMGIIMPFRAEQYIETAKSEPIASLWTDSPELALTGAPFNFLPLILVGVSLLILAVIGLPIFLIVKNVRKRKKQRVNLETTHKS